MQAMKSLKPRDRVSLNLELRDRFCQLIDVYDMIAVEGENMWLTLIQNTSINTST